MPISEVHARVPISRVLSLFAIRFYKPVWLGIVGGVWPYCQYQAHHDDMDSKQAMGASREDMRDGTRDEGCEATTAE